MPTTLHNASESINGFLYEADKCVDSDCGFASMLCVFAVIEAISEAIAGKPAETRKLFSKFLRHMDDQSSWLIPPKDVDLSQDYLVQILSETRHGLVHQLSLPSGIVLIDSVSNAPILIKDHVDVCILGIYEFVRAVDKTANSIIKAHPDAILDPAPRGNRGTAQTYIVQGSE